MSLYDEYKNALLDRKNADQRQLAEIENEISSLVELLHEELGWPPEAIELLTPTGVPAYPFDFAPDDQGYTKFSIELKVHEGDEILDTINVPMRGVPAMGKWKRIIEVGGKQVDGPTDSFSSPGVVAAIKSILQKRM